MWIAILAVSLVFLYIACLVGYEIYCHIKHKPGLGSDCADLCKGKGQKLVAAYKAMKKKEEEAAKTGE